MRILILDFGVVIATELYLRFGVAPELYLRFGVSPELEARFVKAPLFRKIRSALFGTFLGALKPEACFDALKNVVALSKQRFAHHWRCLAY